MDGRDLFADLAAEVRALRNDCDRVADVLWMVAALLREADASRLGYRTTPPTACHQRGGPCEIPDPSHTASG